MAVNVRTLKFGINKATSGSWGTGAADATAVGAGDGHYVFDDIGTVLNVQRSDDTSAGQTTGFIGSVQTATTEAINSAIPMFLHYHDTFQNVLWGLACGTGGTSPTQIGTSTAYTNTFEPATNRTGSYATIVRDKGQFIEEVPGAKFTGFEISFGDLGRAEIRWNIIGDTLKSNSAINTSTQVGALTFPTQGLRAFMDDCVLRINTSGGGALDTVDAFAFSNLRIRYAQPMDIIFVGGQVTIIEPEDNDFPTMELEVEYPRFDNQTDDFFAWHRDNTFLKLDVTFTGAAIDATSNYGIKFQLPFVDVRQANFPAGGGASTVAVRSTLRAYATTTAPTGMTGITKPFRIVTTGVSTANPFA